MRVSVSLVIGFLLVAALVCAQNVQVSVVAPQPGTKQVFQYLYEGSGFITVDLGAQMSLMNISVSLNAYLPYSQSSDSLCARFDSDQSELCVPVSAQTSKAVFYPQGKSARNIQLSLRGFSQGGGYMAYIRQVDWVGGQGRVVTQSLSSFGGTAPVSLGTVRDFVSQQPGADGVRVSSDNPLVVAWFSDGALPPGQVSPTSRTQTVQPADVVMACLNSDLNLDASGNPSCDYVDEAACAARGRDWFKGNCCGDAPYASCGFYQDKQALCGQDAQGRFVWAQLSPPGVVVKLGTCPRVDVVSDGSKFFSCAQPSVSMPQIERFQGKIGIAGHEYVCDGDSVIECGGTSPFSQGAKRPGATFVIAGETQVCGADGKWKVSFDGDQASCQAANLGWTGTKCCGEPSDPLTTYEEPSGTGGCFRKQLVRSGDTIANNRDVVNHRGKFYICEPDVAQQSPARALFDNTGVTPIIARACGDPLQNTVSGSLPHAICSPQGSWSFVSSTELHKPKQVPWQPSGVQVRSGCCPAGMCWDGNLCRDRGSTVLIAGKGYKCQ